MTTRGRITIKPVRTEQDRYKLVKLHQECFKGKYLILPEDGWWFLAWCGDRAVGYAGMTVGETPLHGDMVRSGVQEGYRGRGIQKRLLAAREKQARRQGMTALTSYTSCDNAPSMNSLIAAGFRTQWPDDTGRVEGEYFVYWRKSLEDN